MKSPWILAAPLLFAGLALSEEGQWQPHQLPELIQELRKIGITADPKKLADLNQAPLNAIVSLGGCSASFVSADALVITNHHCAYGDIQQNSTENRNLLQSGFLAKSKFEELPAAPSTRIYVTDQVENVTDRVIGQLKPEITGKERYDEVQKRIKQLIAECEADKAYRCSVPSFHRGMEYYRIRQLMIRDVRLVYAPSAQIGNFGGEIDNFEWPRHTGDFAFLRAYVGKDGRPADPSPDNKPYKPKSFLSIAPEGIREGDPILLAGYPGRTSRYRLPAEIRFVRDQGYPRRIAESKADIAAIEAATQGSPEREVRYASVIKGIQNGFKKTQGLLDGFSRKDIVAIKEDQDKIFRLWISKQADAEQQMAMLSQLDKLIEEDQQISEEQFAYGLATQSDLLKAALTLYRLGLEKQKPDGDRETGFQERDWPFLEARLKRLDKTFDAEVDLARWKAALIRYKKLDSALHPAKLDTLLPEEKDLAALFKNTNLSTSAQRLEWMKADVSAMEQSKDPFLQLAKKLMPLALDLENRRKDIDGRMERVIPSYMKSIIAWKRSLGKPVYPDANSTLRVTYGRVASYSPADGLTKGPFTTLDGVLAKARKEDPFEIPDTLRKAITSKQYGRYRDPKLGTVPVNFLSTADTTGGNSGSAVLNKRGQLIGLNFDSTYESITKDWYFDESITRAIHVDIRYILWVMQFVDKADTVLQELSLR